MAKKFRDLVNETMTPQQQAEASRMAAEMRAAMPLQELRRARELSQKQLAQLLEREQGDVSKIEHRTDMYVSTLRSYIEAMGGRLDIVAHFPEGEVLITQFEEIGHTNHEEAHKAVA